MKTQSPLQSNSTKKVCKLKTDNYATPDYWIITDALSVSIVQQKIGKSPKQEITIPIKDFNKLIRWYIKPQKIK